MRKLATKVISHPLFSGSFVMVAGSMGVNVINYVYHVIMGRVLGPVSYGTLLSLYSILYLVSIIPMSTSVSIVKFISAAKNKKELVNIYSGVNRLILKIAIVSSILMVIASPAIANFLKIKELFAVIMMAPILFLSLVTLVNQASSQGLLKFSGVVGPNVVSAVGKFVLGLLFVFIGWGVMGAVGGVALGAAFAYLVSLSVINKIIPKIKARDFDLSPFIKFALPALFQALAFTSFFTVDVLLAKHYLTPFDAGIYSAISTLGKIIYFAATPIASVMFPIVSGRHAKGEKYHQVFYAAFLATVVLSLGVTGIYWLFPKIAIGILFGAKYLSAQSELVWMSLFISFLTISFLLVNFLLSIGKVKIVIFPVIVAIVQLGAIMIFHDNLLQIIQVSLGSMIILFFGLSSYMMYNGVPNKGSSKINQCNA